MNHPDFVQQVNSVEQKIRSEWQTVQEGWKDNVAAKFDNDNMQPFMLTFKKYVTGDGISGYGLEQLMQQMDRHQQDMDSLAN